jgi:hypothetical protein
MAQTATNPQTGEKLQLDEGTNTWVPVSAKPAEWSELMGNVPASAAKAGGDILSTLNPANWPEMLSALGKTAVGGIAKSNRLMSEQFPKSAGIEPYPKASMEQYPEAFKQYVTERAGSPEAIKQTLITDPVGALLDVSGLLSGGGAIAAKQGGLLGKAGMMTDPVNIMKGTAKAATGAITPATLPANLYKSAAKFPTTLDTKLGRGTRTRLAETALKHKILPTEEGLIKLAEYDKALGTKIGGLIDEATKSGKSIPKSKVFKHLKEARRSVGGVRVGAKENVQQINKIAKDLDKQMKGIKGNTLSPRQLQDLKISAQSAAKYEQGTIKETGKLLASKEIAKGAKEGIEELVPEVGVLNQELAKLKELADPLGRAASRIENRDLISIGTPIKSIAGAEAFGERGAIVGALAGMAESKKAQIAIKLKELQDAGLGNLIDPSVRATLIQQGLLQSGRADEDKK